MIDITVRHLTITAHKAKAWVIVRYAVHGIAQAPPELLKGHIGAVPQDQPHIIQEVAERLLLQPVTVTFHQPSIE